MKYNTRQSTQQTINKNSGFVLISIFIVFSMLMLTNCQKEDVYKGEQLPLSFSTDTVQFDTLFTTLSSITKSFTVHNTYDKTLKIDEIRLSGGSHSAFRINIDGIAAPTVQNIEIKGNDSIYIFVETTLDANNASAPMIVEENISFIRKDQQKKVQLVAYGQDVHILKDWIVKTDATWQADKPYLIEGDLLIDTNKTLRLSPGVQLFFRQDSRMYIAGTLLAEGNLEQPVMFSGDRLDSDYKNIPGQWEGLWFLAGSKDSRLSYSEVKNAIIGIQADSVVGTNPTVTLENTLIRNMTSTALYARGAYINAYNSLFANCGQYLAALTIGGNYSFNHCTFANYWRYSTRRVASVLLNNYYTDINNTEQPRPLKKAYFGNCLIYGSRPGEITLDATEATEFNVSFEGSFAKVEQDFPDFLEAQYRNINPKFIDPYNHNYQLDTLSPVKDQGILDIANLYPTDLLGNSRLIDLGPDPGAYERIEEAP